MTACYHTNTVRCDNCRNPFEEQMLRVVEKPPVMYPWFPAVPTPLSPPVRSCREHCYCGEETVNNKSHAVCCMCMHRKVK